MEFKHKRGNCLILFEKITEIPLLIAGIIVSVILFKQLDTDALFPFIVIIINPVLRLLNYLFTYYTLTEDHLIIESGILTKKRTEIPFATITTVDLSQNILFQIFKVYKIKVDNASQINETANKSNVKLTLKQEEALLFKEIITNAVREETNVPSENGEKEEKGAINAAMQDFLKLGLLQSKFVYIFSVVAVAGPLSGLILPKLENVFIGPLVAAAVLIIYLLAIAVSLAKSIITYYNFSATPSNDALKIQYGLFNKKSYVLQKDKINGIILKQNLMMKLCKLYTAEVIVIGYGDGGEEGTIEKAIVYPIASMNRLKEVIGYLLPEYRLTYELHKSEPRALRYFFFSPDFAFMPVIFAAAIIISIITGNYIPLACAAVVLVIFVMGALLKYSNAGISMSKDNVVLSTGSFHKKVFIVKTGSIESITSSGSFFKRAKGFVSIRIGIIAPLRVGIIAAYNLPVEQFEILEDMLEY